MAGGHRHVAIDYYAYLSKMASWNSVGKVLFSLGAILLVLFADCLWVSVFTLGYMAYLVLWIGKIPAGDYIRLLKVPLVFVLLGSVAIGIEFDLTSVTVTKESLQLAFTTGMKAMASVSALYVMTLSTPMGEIIGVLRKFHVPGMILELMHLIYRYIFILSEIHHQQQDAARSRLGGQSLAIAMRTFSSEAATLLILSLKKAGAYYDAMEARCYNGQLDLFWQEKKVTGAQLLWYGSYFALAVVVFRIERIGN